MRNVEILVYFLHWCPDSFTVKNATDLVKIWVKKFDFPRSVVPLI